MSRLCNGCTVSFERRGRNRSIYKVKGPRGGVANLGLCTSKFGTCEPWESGMKISIRHIGIQD